MSPVPDPPYGPPSAQTVTMPAGAVAGRSRIRRLVVVFAPATPARAALVLGDVAVGIGRGGVAGVTLQVSDPQMSRLHARIELEGDGHVLTDGGSRNGTWVDGRRTERVRLEPGMVVRAGGTVMVYTEDDVGRDEPLVPPTPALIGHSVAMQRLRGELALVAGHAVSVLILGESGVGKERASEEIHRQSGRPGPFVAVNCAAIPAALAERELFGHVAGAYTGAAGASDGLFAAAHRGTLLLDEIGELPLGTQAKLLRALAAGEVRPVGATDVRHVDVRVVAATHRDLEKAVAAGEFRGDLYARLAAWIVRIPPLRERRDDVLELAAAALRRQGTRARLTARAAEALVVHGWPYNVRELEQVLAAAVVRAGTGKELRLDHLPAPIAARVEREERASTDGGTTAAPPLAAVVDRRGTPSRDELVEVLVHHRGNVADVAALYGKDRRQVYRWLERHGLDAAVYRPADAPPEPAEPGPGVAAGFDAAAAAADGDADIDPDAVETVAPPPVVRRDGDR